MHIEARKLTWQSWAILIMGTLVVLSWVPTWLSYQQEQAAQEAAAAVERAEMEQAISEQLARLELPEMSDIWDVGFVKLDRSDEGRLVVFTDAKAMVPFRGRYKVTLRDEETQRHQWTPFWSEWIDYAANPGGTRYKQPEPLWWWAGLAKDDFVEPPPNSWFMETCWEAEWHDEILGTVVLEPPLCVTSLIDEYDMKQQVLPEEIPDAVDNSPAD